MNVYSLIIFLLITVFSLSQKRYFFYHSTKKTATKEVKPTYELYWGYAKAIDRNEKEIYHSQIRNIAGHSSVNFDYNTSGAVQKARFTGY